MEYHGLNHNNGIAYRATLDTFGRFWFTAFSIEGYEPGNEAKHERFINDLLPNPEVNDIIALNVRSV
jgi:hypothetical protein